MHEQVSGHCELQDASGKSGGKGGQEGEGKWKMEAESARVTEAGRQRVGDRRNGEGKSKKEETAEEQARERESAGDRVHVCDERDTVRKERGWRER